jgi:hypothetical protein
MRAEREWRDSKVERGRKRKREWCIWRSRGGTDENAMFSQTEFHVVRLNRRKRFLRQPIISRLIARALVLMPESLGIYVDDIRSS